MSFEFSQAVASVDKLAHTMLSSVLLVALVWIAVWSYSIWSGRKQHKELIKRLDRIESFHRITNTTKSKARKQRV